MLTKGVLQTPGHAATKAVRRAQSLQSLPSWVASTITAASRPASPARLPDDVPKGQVTKSGRTEDANLDRGRRRAASSASSQEARAGPVLASTPPPPLEPTIVEALARQGSSDSPARTIPTGVREGGRALQSPARKNIDLGDEAKQGFMRFMGDMIRAATGPTIGPWLATVVVVALIAYVAIVVLLRRLLPLFTLAAYYAMKEAIQGPCKEGLKDARGFLEDTGIWHFSGVFFSAIHGGAAAFFTLWASPTALPPLDKHASTLRPVQRQVIVAVDGLALAQREVVPYMCMSCSASTSPAPTRRGSL